MKKRLEISDLGEFGLIDRITSQVTLRNTSSLEGIGDDAAVIEGGESSILLSSDMLTEGVHFDLSYVPLKHLGYKSVVVNISDIAAMNGTAEQIVINLGLSNRFSVEAVEEIYRGINIACEKYQVDLVGGDTTSSKSGLILSVSVLGRAKKQNIVYRKGAKTNDILCVTGDLGSAYIGLQVLEREKKVFLSDKTMQPQLEEFEYMIGRQLKPEARTDIIRELAERNIMPTSMIDVSDGLVTELLHLSARSKLGIRLYEEKIPVDQRMCHRALTDFSVNPLTCALHGGEDYELLFSVKQNDFDKLKEHPDIHFIGYFHDDPTQNEIISSQGKKIPLQAQGWGHFQKNQSMG